MRSLLITMILAGFLLLGGCARPGSEPILPTELPATATVTLLPPTSQPALPTPLPVTATATLPPLTPQQPLSPMPTPTESKSEHPSEPTAEITPSSELHDREDSAEEKISESAALARAAEAAKSIAATALDVAASRLEVKEIEAVTWPDTSLGCPQPGYLYAQVLTPGYKVVLTTDERVVEVHLDARGQGIVCSTDD